MNEKNEREFSENAIGKVSKIICKCGNIWTIIFRNWNGTCMEILQLQDFKFKKSPVSCKWELGGWFERKSIRTNEYNRQIMHLQQNFSYHFQQREQNLHRNLPLEYISIEKVVKQAVNENFWAGIIRGKAFGEILRIHITNIRSNV